MKRRGQRHDLPAEPIIKLRLGCYDREPVGKLCARTTAKTSPSVYFAKSLNFEKKTENGKTMNRGEVWRTRNHLDVIITASYFK